MQGGRLTARLRRPPLRSGFLALLAPRGGCGRSALPLPRQRIDRPRRSAASGRLPPLRCGAQRRTRAVSRPPCISLYHRALRRFHRPSLCAYGIVEHHPAPPAPVGRPDGGPSTAGNPRRGRRSRATVRPAHRGAALQRRHVCFRNLHLSSDPPPAAHHCDAPQGLHVVHARRCWGTTPGTRRHPRAGVGTSGQQRRVACRLRNPLQGPQRRGPSRCRDSDVRTKASGRSSSGVPFGACWRVAVAPFFVFGRCSQCKGAWSCREARDL